ncbi:MAG TPA: MFS transporter [Nevskiales bacterium]|nr:MFS transporter [Nevskiales bacterium]
MNSERRDWQAALASYGRPRVLAMLFLGFSAGLPFLLVFSTLSAWLAQAGISRTEIGLLSWIGITYSIKFFWAPVVDRLPLPLLTRALGRRRGWMLLAQLGIAGGLYGLSLSDPGNGLAPLVWLALLVAFASATQDIVIDAWRIEAAESELQGSMAAAYQFGYRVALIVAGAGTLFVAADWGWSLAYLAMAVCACVGIVTTLVIAEPAAHISRDTALREARVLEYMARNAHLPQLWRTVAGWFIGAVVCPFVDFFARNGVKTGALILLFIGLFRVTDITMGVMANPFYLDIGYTLKEIAAVAKVYGVILSMVGVFVGGLAVFRYGSIPVLIVSGILVILTNLAFATLAFVTDPGIAGLMVVISADNFSAGLAGTAFIAYLSGLTNTAYTATQYALFSSLFTLPGKLIAGGSGWVVDQFGYVFFFFYTSALGVPALLLVIYLSRRLPARPAGSP